MSRAPAVCLVLVAATVSDASAQQGRWGVEVGHSYSSAKALHEPATFTVNVADSITTVIDGGLLVGGPIGSGGSLEFGVRASAGSARTQAKRVYGAIARGYHTLPSDWVGALSGEYEADGGFDVQKGIVGLEVTPLGNPRWCLGVRCPGSHLQWRPWLGAGVGNTFKGATGLSSPEDRTFVRAYLRGELSWVPRTRVELNAEITGWFLTAHSDGRSAATGSLAIPLGRGFSIAAKGAIGRPPPRFLYARALSAGLGYVLRRSQGRASP